MRAGFFRRTITVVEDDELEDEELEDDMLKEVSCEGMWESGCKCMWEREGEEAGKCLYVCICGLCIGK